MNPIGTLILAFLILVVLCGTRRWALLAMMAGALYLTQNINVNLAGLNMWATRFLELAGFFRVMSRHEFSFRQMNKIDHALLLLYVCTTMVFLLRSTTGQAYQIGTAVDAFLSYFTFRGLLRNMDEFRCLLRDFVYLLAPYTLLVVIESRTGHNPFTVLGGVEGGSDWMRHGRPRCFGSFRQPDTLGMFAASFLPLFIGMACMVKERRRALIAISLLFVIVWAANSGAESAAALTGLACWGFWRFRTKMRTVRWSIVAIIIALALVMKAPIWYIFERVSSVTGGDGWHRSYLIDVAYQHIDKWWLAGIPVTETSGWFPYGLATTGGMDITNQYIAFGVTAGLGGIVLFIFLLVRTFSYLGKASAFIRSAAQQAGDTEFLLWGLGVMLVVHIINWFGITYFDQMYMVWFMQLAAISSISASCLAVQLQTRDLADLPGEPEPIRPAAQFEYELPQK